MTSSDRRTAIFGTSVIVCLLGAAKGVPAGVAWQRGQTVASFHAGQLLAAASIDPAELRSARDSLAARRARFDALDAALPAAATASEAVANLASTLEDLADSCGVRVSSIQLRSDSVTSRGLTEVSARVNGVADVAGLASLLHAIAASENPLVVRELSVTASDPTAPSTRAEALRFDVLVAGLAHTGVRPKA